MLVKTQCEVVRRVGAKDVTEAPLKVIEIDDVLGKQLLDRKAAILPTDDEVKIYEALNPKKAASRPKTKPAEEPAKTVAEVENEDVVG
jgi:hypothetical protein